MTSRLKSLELHGYKTFASRTVFDFPSAVTAIVGPNGSGKSNIADAMRWVLGEQSYSLLRGKKTEDMIFAGSEQRSRSGMAAVTVVFDNEDHWLPIDFAEVAITRRAYRDGQNEYILNGQRVRLKDVFEVLSQSGLAERTYTIIGQGLVDAALALKAEERRRLFEEAAGIGLHRSRKEEALRRLELTLRNLERVQDILAELEPRLRSLERQARRAHEYERLKDQLKDLLREWYGYHWHRAQTELLEAQAVARQQERQLRAARSAQQVLDKQLQTYRLDLQQNREQLNTWHHQSAELHTRRESISRELAVADERQYYLLEQEREYRDQITGLEEQLGLLEERLEEASSELESHQAELFEAGQQADLANHALAERLQAREIASSQLEQARRLVAGLDARQVELNARLAERREWMARQDNTLAELRKAIQLADEAVRLADQERLQAAQLFERAAQKTADAQGRLSAQQEKVSAGEAALQDLLAEIAGRKTELTRLQTQLSVLLEAEQALTGFAEGARLLLEAARQQQLPGIRGALISRIEVPEGLEQAVAAAFGEFLDAVVLETAGEADRALKLLEGKPGRGILLPVDSMLTEEPARWQAEDGEVLGIAAELVEAPAEVRPMVDLLLGKTLIVRDRQTARRVIEAVRRTGLEKFGVGFRAVTLQGDVFYASGAVQSGQENRSLTLSQARKRKNLQVSIAAQQKELQALEGQMARDETGLGGERASLRELEIEFKRWNGEQESAAASHRQRTAAYEQALSHAKWQKEQEANLEAEASWAEAEFSQISSDLDSTGISLEAARRELEERLQIYQQIAVEDVQEQANHWNLQSALAQRALDEAQTRLLERQAALAETQARKANLEERISENYRQASELEDRKQTLRLEVEEVGRSLGSLQDLIGPAEEELALREGDQLQKQTEEAQARQSLNQAEQHHAQAKINLIRRQEALETLRRRVEDDFGLVAFEYAEEVTGPNPLPLAGLVEQLPVIEDLSPDTEESLKRQRALIRRMGPVNPEAQTEYQEVKARYEFLVEQVGDLRKAEADIHAVIAQLDDVMEQEFKKTFDQVAEQFHTIFGRLFGGGSARLVMTDPGDLTTTGIDIEARLPGRREQGLSLLSGGERSLTAVALVFALLRVSPTPFCVLDEVDAMLDEANVGRFRDLLRELSQSTQFILITHNRNTVQVAEVIYGITMGHDSTSQTVSLKVDQVENAVAEPSA